MNRLATVLFSALVVAACGREGDSAPSRGEAAGIVDAEFGIGGIAAVLHGSRLPGTVNDILELDDGSLLVGGKNGYVAKFTADGKPDPAFAGSGIDDTRRGTATFQDVERLALLASGRIAVVEIHRTPCPHPVFCGTDFGDVVARRIDRNGAADPSYGVAGLATLPFSRGSIVVSPNGRVTSFSRRVVPIATIFAVASLDPSGMRDPAYEDRALQAVQSCAGKFFDHIEIESVTGLAAEDRTLVFAAWSGWVVEQERVPFLRLAGNGACLMRLGADGGVDTAFAVDGQQTYMAAALTRSMAAFRVLSRADGEIVLVPNPSREPGVSMRPAFLFFSASGAPDLFQFASMAGAFINDATLQSNGKVVTVGFDGLDPGASTLPVNEANPLVWRSSPDAGTSDAGFGPAGAGFAMIKSGDRTVWPRKVLVDRNGAIVVGGHLVGTDEGALLRFR